MKKFIIFVLAFLAIGGICYAESSAITWSHIPRQTEMVVYVEAYNPAATAITSNAVVVLSPGNAANMSYKATGAVVAYTTTQDDPLVFGVTDEVMPAQGSGRVCIRGPHRVMANTTGGGLVAGASMATTTSSGVTTPLAVQSQSNSVLGTLLSTTSDPILGGDGVPLTGALYWVEIRR